MKTRLIFSLFLLPSLLFGQVVNHFGNLDSKWNVAKTYPAANEQNPTFAATTTTVFGFQGDTLINGEQWFKLYSTTDSLFQNDLVYHGLVRAVNNQVLFIDALNQLSTLYDFTLNVSDSVLFNIAGMSPEWLNVTTVDSIQLNGSYYKRIKFSEPTINAFDVLNEVWIEGIGSIHGPLFPTNPVKFSQEIPDSMFVTCSFSNNQQVWQHPSYSNCYTNIVLGVDQLELTDLNLYPNPFTDKIHIENSGKEQYNLTILNSLGQTIQQLHFNHEKQTIDLAGLKTGVYLVRIENRSNSNTIRIIKQF
jgi:hypothetical protein